MSDNKQDGRFPDHVTLGDKYGPAMEVRTQGEADAYLEKCVEHTMRHGKSREEATKIELANIGYWTGYYDRETVERVLPLFKTTHPVFGRTWPSPEEAFRKGVEMGQGSGL
jgi:hypothetical protein